MIYRTKAIISVVENTYILLIKQDVPVITPLLFSKI